MELDMNKLPPELQMKLANIMEAMEEREPEGEVSYESDCLLLNLRVLFKLLTTSSRAWNEMRT